MPELFDKMSAIVAAAVATAFLAAQRQNRKMLDRADQKI
jgi:hypothetical protein